MTVVRTGEEATANSKAGDRLVFLGHDTVPIIVTRCVRDAA